MTFLKWQMDLPNMWQWKGPPVYNGLTELKIATHIIGERKDLYR